MHVNKTISACTNGVLFRNNPTPGIGVATNLIVWGNVNNVVISNASALEIAFSDIEGTNWPGTGNISGDPLFVNAAAVEYRLRAGSPAIGTGAGGVDMGAVFPVGGIPARPLQLAALVSGTSLIQLQWQ